MKHIFIDTNIFYNNWHLTSADFKLLFNYLENTESVLLMSDLVCEEVENIRNRELELIINTLKKELKKTKKFSSRNLEIDFDKLEEEEYNFQNLLREKAYKVDFISYTRIRQKAVVERALKITKPFQKDEKGYRDTLIWLSFLSYLSSKKIKNDVIFITNNKSDFYKNGDFHNDLKSDIEKRKLKCSIKPCNSLFNFIKEHVDKEEHEFTISDLFDNHLNLIDSELEIESVDYINNISENEFKEILDKNSLKTFPFINTLISHSIELIEGVEDPEILNYKRISSNSIYVSFRFNLRICALEFTVPTSEYNTNRGQIDKTYFEIFSDENLTSFCDYVRMYLDVSFEYNMESLTISGFNPETIDFK